MADWQFGETEVTRRLIVSWPDQSGFVQQSEVGEQEIRAFLESGEVTAKDLQSLTCQITEAWRGK
jgi:hypothetical protein